MTRSRSARVFADQRLRPWSSQIRRTDRIGVARFLAGHGADCCRRDFSSLLRVEEVALVDAEGVFLFVGMVPLGRDLREASERMEHVDPCLDLAVLQ
jgi:hypothetical protein